MSNTLSCNDGPPPNPGALSDSQNQCYNIPKESQASHEPTFAQLMDKLDLKEIKSKLNQLLGNDPKYASVKKRLIPKLAKGSTNSNDTKFKQAITELVNLYRQRCQEVCKWTPKRQRQRLWS